MPHNDVAPNGEVLCFPYQASVKLMMYKRHCSTTKKADKRAQAILFGGMDV